MKSFSFAKALAVGAAMCLALPIACGDDETNPSKPSGGGSNASGDAGAGGEPGAEGGAPGAEGGAGPAIMIPGTSEAPKTIKCGSEMCTSVSTLAGLYVDPCCAADSCGVSTPFFNAVGASFTDTCQAVDQRGDEDEACPSSADQMVPVMGALYSIPGFAGCCRADTGTCGVVVNDVAVSGIPLPFASPMLGCVDSAPFFDGVEGKPCGAGGAGGAGGVGGAGGAGGAGDVGAGGAAAGAGGVQ